MLNKILGITGIITLILACSGTENPNLNQTSNSQTFSSHSLGINGDAAPQVANSGNTNPSQGATRTDDSSTTYGAPCQLNHVSFSGEENCRNGQYSTVQWVCSDIAQSENRGCSSRNDLRDYAQSKCDAACNNSNGNENDNCGFSHVKFNETHLCTPSNDDIYGGNYYYKATVACGAEGDILSPNACLSESDPYWVTKGKNVCGAICSSGNNSGSNPGSSTGGNSRPVDPDPACGYKNHSFEGVTECNPFQDDGYGGPYFDKTLVDCNDGTVTAYAGCISKSNRIWNEKAHSACEEYCENSSNGGTVPPPGQPRR